MADQTHVPTLGPGGWINAPADVMDLAIGSFLASNYSDTTTNRATSLTMPYILQQNTNQILLLQEALQTELDKKLQRYFGDSARAEVQMDADPKHPDQYTIRFLGTIYVDGKPYIAGKLVQFDGSRVVAIARINNA